MIIHTVVPLELVLADQEQISAPVEVQLNGILMQVQRLEGNKARIIRLISPEPHHYLDDKLQPGNIISL